MSHSLLPESTRMDEVHLRTGNLASGVAFYENVLGLVSTRRADGQAVLGGPGSVFLRLMEEPGAVPPLRPTVGLYHFAILYPTRRDLAQALQRLVQHNWPIEGASDHLVSEAIYLRDRENNGVELYWDRPRSEWKWNNGQVAMATEPLDLEDLLVTAETPLPERVSEDTRLGHIHLHVGDLNEAERFFHECLSFDVTQRSYPGARFFSAGGYHHHIGANTWAGKNLAQRNSTGLISYRFVVPSKAVIETIEQRAKDFGYTFGREGAAGEILRIKDPSSGWFELSAVG